MSTSKSGKEEIKSIEIKPPEPESFGGVDEPEQPATPTDEERKKQIVDGFRAIAEAHKNIWTHLDAYATWLEKTDLSDAALQLQIELLTALHAKLQ